MANLDDSENAKVSDSAYSTSCSNSRSRRSHSSKSTHSGSHSSGSSGYGGNPSTSGYSSNNQSHPVAKRPKCKESRKKKPMLNILTNLAIAQVDKKKKCIPESAPSFETSETEISDAAPTPTPVLAQIVKVPELMLPDRTTGKNELALCTLPVTFVTSCPLSSQPSEGFSCVISMHDGVVMYTTASITPTLGFPKDMWLGRSFIDFLHQRDRNTFASQITNGLADPKQTDTKTPKATVLGGHISSMMCRIRRYKGLTSGFGIKDKVVTYMPFQLKFFFKNKDEDGNEGNTIYLVVQASPFMSAFKTPNEILSNPIPFVIRHSASGKLEYIDPESVSYLGYLPQDVQDTDALKMYHPADLMYLHQVYGTIMKEGGLQRSKPYRMMAQNGYYLKLETEWTSYVNPWSHKLEFVNGKHFIIEGPTNPDVFQTPEPEKYTIAAMEEERKAQGMRENIIRAMNELLTKPAAMAKQQMTKRCEDLACFMESLIEETPKLDDELRLDIQETDHSYFVSERDTVMLGGISPHHDYNETRIGTEAPSYNQLNYNDNLERFFNSHKQFQSDENMQTATCESPNTPENPIASTSKCTFNFAPTNNRPASEPGTSYTDTPRGKQNKLTESLLSQHNAEMEKELVKSHRETRLSNKSERDKASFETRKKKKEHLARCNATFQPTNVELTDFQSQGVKRSSNENAESSKNKYKCTSPRQRKPKLAVQVVDEHQPTTKSSTVPASQPWSSYTANNMNTVIVGFPQQMPAVPTTAMQGGIPYCNTIPQQPYPFRPITTTVNHAHSQHIYPNINTFNPNMQYQRMQDSNVVFQMNAVRTTTAGSHRMYPNYLPPAQYGVQPQYPPFQYNMMYGQTAYGSPAVYYNNPQVQYGLHPQPPIPQYTPPVGLSHSNYEEACKLSTLPKPTRSYSRREKIGDIRARGSAFGNSSVNASFRSYSRVKRDFQFDNSDGTFDKTDGESSYSSFYSSFFKTDSGSNEESDARISYTKEDVCNPSSNRQKTHTYLRSPYANNNVHNEQNPQRRKMQPPWMENVSVTSELIYKYQIVSKNLEEVLSSDRDKLKRLEQPTLVNEQLSQLYTDLQLGGVASKLVLEEGITSSSSSGEEATVKSNKQTRRRKREYSRLTMIYEENAPIPSPAESSYSC